MVQDLLRLESKEIFIALANSRIAEKFDRELNLGWTTKVKSANIIFTHNV